MEFHDKSNPEITYQALEKAQKKVEKAPMLCADDGSDLREGTSAP